MKLKIFTVYDSKAEAYLPPFYDNTAATAMRAFGNAVQDQTHQFAKHPEDYTLFELGTYDDQDATFDLHEAKHSLGTAIEYTENFTQN